MFSTINNSCSAGARGHTKRLQSYHLANVDLNQVDLSGRTALHMAALHGKEECVTFLLEKGVNSHIKDIRGETPEDLARVMNHNAIAQLIAERKQECKCNGTGGLLGIHKSQN